MKYKISKKRLQEIIGKKVNLQQINKEGLKTILNDYFEGNSCGKIERRLQITDDYVLIGFKRGVMMPKMNSEAEMVGT